MVLFLIGLGTVAYLFVGAALAGACGAGDELEKVLVSALLWPLFALFATAAWLGEKFR